MGDAVYQYQKKTVRKMILKDHKRPDGRKIDEIRPLAAEVDLLPRVHGSGTVSYTHLHPGAFFRLQGVHHMEVSAAQGPGAGMLRLHDRDAGKA